jgi:hypothetical protein
MKLPSGLVAVVSQVCRGLILGAGILGSVASGAKADDESVMSKAVDWLQKPRSLTYIDTRIGDPLVSYKDQEFYVDARLMVWQDELEQIWICRFDARTGLLDPLDGRGKFVGVGAPVLTPTVLLQNAINGPEFGYSQRGLGIYYVSGSSASDYQATRYDLTSEETTILGGGFTSGSRGVLPSQDWSLPSCRVLFGRVVADTTSFISEWFDEDDPAPPEAFPQSSRGTSGPRWILHEPALLTNVFDANGIPQINRYDLDTRTVTPLTAGPHVKIDAIPFTAPEHPHRRLFVCTADSQWIGVYRQDQPVWQNIHRIFPPGAASEETPPEVSSVEPVIFRGRTYFTYVAKYADGATRICLASLDGRLNEFISNAGSLRQIDPEGVAVGNRLFVYYWTAANAEGFNELRLSQVSIWP